MPVAAGLAVAQNFSDQLLREMPRLSDIDWVFFDLGNTLISEQRAIEDRIEQIVRALEERGVRVSARTIEHAFQEASAEFAPRLIAGALEKIASDREDRAYVLRTARYRSDLDAPYPEACELLSTLGPRYSIGVIANQSAGAEDRLKRYGLAPFISLCLSSAKVGMAKPDPAIFRLALDRARCQPHQAVMIGDRIDNDIRPAKSLGWRTIRVLCGFARFQAPRTPEDEADFTVSHLSEIIPILC